MIDEVTARWGQVKLTVLRGNVMSMLARLDIWRYIIYLFLVFDWYPCQPAIIYLRLNARVITRRWISGLLCSTSCEVLLFVCILYLFFVWCWMGLSSGPSQSGSRYGLPDTLGRLRWTHRIFSCTRRIFWISFLPGISWLVENAWKREILLHSKIPTPSGIPITLLLLFLFCLFFLSCLWVWKLLIRAINNYTARFLTNMDTGAFHGPRDRVQTG